MRHKITATVKDIVFCRTTQTDRIILVNIEKDDKFFRDHLWIKTTNRLKHLKSGDKFQSTAELIKYIGCKGEVKWGFKTFRSIKVLE